MKQTQYDLIIRFCKNHEYITPMNAFALLGITKLATRISEMSKKGYIFEKKLFTYTDMFGNSKEYMKYKLIKEPDAKEAATI